jgi:spore cortex formation protein SpoVR/YcgB (stage V sporulation)
VDAIHNERGYRALRRRLARQYDIGRIDPHIEIVDADLADDRKLILQHKMLDGAPLAEEDTRRTLAHLADLWGYGVVLREIDGSNVVREFEASPRPGVVAGP